MTESEIRLPDVGEGIARAEVVQWHVAVGDRIVEDQPFVDVMTDKATVELPSPISGVVTRLAAEVGDFVAVGAPLIWVTSADTGPQTPAIAGIELTKSETSTGSSSVPDPTPAARAPTSVEPVAARSTGTGSASRAPRARAAPAVRRRAADLGIDLDALAGTGEAGRVVHADLDAHLTDRHAAPVVAEDRVDRVPLTGLRRNIARRMQEAHRIPHFSYIEQVDVEALEQLRGRLNEQQPERAARLTILPFLMRAVTLAIADFPGMNARFDAESETLERHSAVHLGIAVQGPNGLMVPVIRNAGRNNLRRNASEVRRLADATREGTVRLADLTGSTITITSLGSLGGLMSTPIINAPEVAIVGVNRIVEQVMMADGQLRNRRTMNLSSSFDHRVIDGWDAARFVGRIKDLLENPALLFLDEQ